MDGITHIDGWLWNRHFDGRVHLAMLQSGNRLQKKLDIYQWQADELSAESKFLWQGVCVSLFLDFPAWLALKHFSLSLHRMITVITPSSYIYVAWRKKTGALFFFMVLHGVLTHFISVTFFLYSVTRHRDFHSKKMTNGWSTEKTLYLVAIFFLRPSGKHHFQSLVICFYVRQVGSSGRGH